MTKTKTKVEEKVEAKAVKIVEKKETVGGYVRELILEQKFKDEEILKMVAEKFPKAKTTKSCISWYKTDLRKKNLLQGGRTSSKIEKLKSELVNLQDQNWVEAQIKSIKDQLKVLEAK